MNSTHLLLIILWVLYCITHSFLARTDVKNYFETVMGSSFKYYRPLYSVFAVVTLLLLLWFQFLMASPRLFPPAVLLFIIGVTWGLIGLCIMTVCISKYFYELSGLQALQQPGVKNTLQQSGLHKYVRHPLYLGTLLFIWGLFLVFPFVNNLVAVVIITLYVLAGIKIEERKLRVEYGKSYEDYEKKVPMLIPGFKSG